MSVSCPGLESRQSHPRMRYTFARSVSCPGLESRQSQSSPPLCNPVSVSCPGLESRQSWHDGQHLPGSSVSCPGLESRQSKSQASAETSVVSAARVWNQGKADFGTLSSSSKCQLPGFGIKAKQMVIICCMSCSVSETETDPGVGRAGGWFT